MIYRNQQQTGILILDMLLLWPAESSILTGGHIQIRKETRATPDSPMAGSTAEDRIAMRVDRDPVFWKLLQLKFSATSGKQPHTVSELLIFLTRDDPPPSALSIYMHLYICGCERIRTLEVSALSLWVAKPVLDAVYLPKVRPAPFMATRFSYNNTNPRIFLGVNSVNTGRIVVLVMNRKCTSKPCLQSFMACQSERMIAANGQVCDVTYFPYAIKQILHYLVSLCLRASKIAKEQRFTKLHIE